jgi:hypothetical protein
MRNFRFVRAALWPLSYAGIWSGRKESNLHRLRIRQLHSPLCYDPEWLLDQDSNLEPSR